jgi:DNA-binding HxlR family transcriptional regulator
MGKRGFDDDCTIARTLEVIGERWTLLILRQAFLGDRRFDQLHHSLGIARNILSDRLRALVEEGILDRRLYQDRPPRHDYRLTEKGIDLYPVVLAIKQWGDRYQACEEDPALRLVHRKCEHQLGAVMACGHCGEVLTARSVRPEERERVLSGAG